VPNVAQNAPESKYAKDPRLSRLTLFLERAHSPITHLAVDFLAAADLHSLDWRLLPSISVIETGAGRTAEHNNIFGWDSGRRAFDSVRDAIYHVASRIGHSKLYQHKDLDHVLATYNPVVPEYAGKVKSVMRQVDASQPPDTRLQARAWINPSFALQRTVHPALGQ
jgi:hypothetical protein